MRNVMRMDKSKEKHTNINPYLYGYSYHTHIYIHIYIYIHIHVYLVSILQCGANSEKFIQIIKTSVIGKIAGYGIYGLINPQQLQGM